MENETEKAVVINLDVKPLTPENWVIDEHRTGGLLRFKQANILLYQPKKQIEGFISGHDLRLELADKSVLNANLLDYLLAYPKHVPDNWKNQFVFFWGTIYRDCCNHLCVRYYDPSGPKWHWGYCRLSEHFCNGNPAAIFS